MKPHPSDNNAVSTDLPDGLLSAVAALEDNIARFSAFHAETLRVHALYLQDHLDFTRRLVQHTHSGLNRGYVQLNDTVLEPRLSERVSCRAVRLKVLPQPDRLELVFARERVCLVTDEGTGTTTEVAAALTALGCRVVVLSFPTAIVAARAPLAEGTPRIVLESMDDGHLRDQLARCPEVPVGGFIHLHPAFSIERNDNLLFNENEKAIIKHVFFMAKHLQAPLNGSGQSGRSFFLTATRMDGRLGLGDAANYSPLGGGLAGLVKSLRHEWSRVFCRALDISPQLDTETVLRHLMAELQDPDLLISEVGWDADGRYTIVCEP